MLIANSKSESNTATLVSADCMSAQSARARLVHDIRLSLRRSGHAELRSVEVDVDGDQVLMQGRVPTFYLKQLSQELVRTVAPQHKINNKLVVESHPAKRR